MNFMTYPTKKLGDCIIQFDRGISWSRKDEGGVIAVLRIPNIQEGHINFDDLKHISAKKGNGELHKNDIVMVASNGNPDLVGRSALVTEKEKGMRFASFLVRLKFDDSKLLPQYAHLFLLTPIFKRELRRKIATTSGIYNLRKDHIEKIKIPLPPLTIQKQIFERLDKIAEAQKLNDDLIQKADELFQSLFYNEYELKSNQWGSKKLQEVCESIEQTHPKKIFKKEFSYIDIASIDNDKVIRAQIISVDKAPSRARKVVKTGDTIFSTVRPYLKHVAYISEMLNDSIASTGFCVIRPNTDLVNHHFLHYVVESEHFVKKVLPFQRGANYPAVSDKNIYGIKISLPPLEIQKQIVLKLSAVREYKIKLLEQKEKLKELFDSVLSKSFREDI